MRRQDRGCRHQESVKRRDPLCDTTQSSNPVVDLQEFSDGTLAASERGMRKILVCSFAALALLATKVAAQHEGHHPEEATPQAEKAPEAPAEPQMMGQMMAQRGDIAKLVGELAKSFAAIEAEKDPTALKAKLAEHGKLLKELQAKTQAESKMMEHMHQMMMGDHQKQ